MWNHRNSLCLWFQHSELCCFQQRTQHKTHILALDPLWYKKHLKALLSDHRSTTRCADFPTSCASVLDDRGNSSWAAGSGQLNSGLLSEINSSELAEHERSYHSLYLTPIQMCGFAIGISNLLFYKWSSQILECAVLKYLLKDCFRIDIVEKPV